MSEWQQFLFNSRELDRACYELRRCGLTYQQIADQLLGRNKGRAWQRVARHITRTAHEGQKQ